MTVLSSVGRNWTVKERAEMVTAATLMTIEDYEALGEDAPFELIRGVLYEVAATKYVHMAVSGAFSGYLFIYSRELLPGKVLTGEGGFLLERNPDTLIVPDVSFIRAERLPPKSEKNDWMRVAPDLAIEVKSPSNTRKEIARKIEVYLMSGVPLVWVADTDQETITAHDADGRTHVFRIGDILDGGDVLPGFSVPVAEIFA